MGGVQKLKDQSAKRKRAFSRRGLKLEAFLGLGALTVELNADFATRRLCRGRPFL
jgi:hypothetical protein